MIAISKNWHGISPRLDNYLNNSPRITLIIKHAHHPPYAFRMVISSLLSKQCKEHVRPPNTRVFIYNAISKYVNESVHENHSLQNNAYAFKTTSRTILKSHFNTITWLDVSFIFTFLSMSLMRSVDGGTNGFAWFVRLNLPNSMSQAGISVPNNNVQSSQ